MSTNKLSAAEVEEEIRNHPFPQPGYQPKRYDYTTKSYVDSGEYIEPYTVTMEDDDFSWHDFVEFLGVWAVKKGEPKPSITIPEVGRITLEKQHGGEGKGDEYWFVIRVENEGEPDRFFKQDGWYASYDGGYYDGDFHEVQVVEKVVAFYE